MRRETVEGLCPRAACRVVVSQAPGATPQGPSAPELLQRVPPPAPRRLRRLLVSAAAAGWHVSHLCAPAAPCPSRPPPPLPQLPPMPHGRRARRRAPLRPPPPLPLPAPPLPLPAAPSRDDDCAPTARNSPRPSQPAPSSPHSCGEARRSDGTWACGCEAPGVAEAGVVRMRPPTDAAAGMPYAPCASLPSPGRGYLAAFGTPAFGPLAPALSVPLPGLACEGAGSGDLAQRFGGLLIPAHHRGCKRKGSPCRSSME